LQVREKTMSESIYVGIDISKDTFHVASCPNILKTQFRISVVNIQ